MQLDTMCHERLRRVPRAKGLEPNRLWVARTPHASIALNVHEGPYACAVRGMF